jgi:quercetin dioxygenase-like cupin family protein
LVAENVGMHPSSSLRRALGAAALAFGLVGAGTAAVADTTTTSTSTPTSSSSNGITRTELGKAQPANAPGQELYLQRVTIAPGAKLAQHFHQGTQVARVLSGVLTYDVVSGQALVTHTDGTSETIDAPTTIKLRRGESLVETQGLVHFGSNAGKRPVVIELAALLQAGAPLATPVGQGATGTPLKVVVDLESQSRTLHNAGSDNSITYGWNQLLGNTTVDGQPVAAEMLGNVSYVKGAGPIFGFVTYTFADGSTLGVQFNGAATVTADGGETNFAATLGVLGGTGRYASATGTGIFTGARKAALGTTVNATFDLTITGAS